MLLSKYKIFRRLNLLFKRTIKIITNLTLTIPSKKQIMIFDSNSKILIDLLNIKKRKAFLLDTRYNQIFFFFFLKSIIKRFYKLKFTKLYRFYLEEVIKHINPKIIITIIDNNPFFFELNKFINSKIIAVQSAVRLKSDEKIYNHTPKIDLLFCFGKYQKKVLNNINTKFYAIGSIKNNNFKFKSIKNNKIVFISTIRNFKTVTLQENDIKYNPKKWLNKFKDYTNISFETAYSTEIRFLPLIALYCKENNYELEIIPKAVPRLYKNEEGHPKDFIFECDFYDKILSKIIKNYKIIKKSDWKSAYLALNKKNIIISLNSTLGLEALRQGLKVLFIYKEFWRGWPEQNLIPLLFKNYEDIFWTQSENKENFFNTLNYLTNYCPIKWKKFAKNKIFPKLEKIISYDYGNTKIKKALRQIL